MCRRLKKLKDELMELKKENAALMVLKTTLTSQRDTVNNAYVKLSKQYSEMKVEHDAELDAKELQRQDIADELRRTTEQLDQANRTIEELRAKLTRKGCQPSKKNKFEKK